jgi:hypothetical protein
MFDALVELAERAHGFNQAIQSRRRSTTYAVCVGRLMLRRSWATSVDVRLDVADAWLWFVPMLPFARRIAMMQAPSATRYIFRRVAELYNLSVDATSASRVRSK